MDISSILGNKETWESLFSGTGLDLLKLIIPTFLYVLGILIRKHLKSVLRKILFSFIAGISLSIIITAILVGKGYSPIWFLAITTILITITYSVLHVLQDHSAMREHPNPIDKDIPDTDFKVRLNNIAEQIATDLRDIDRNLDWNMGYFVSLDAEVEMQTRNGRIKKVLDLLNAIKTSDDNLFLVIGDPGAGKSVALRKLCQDLCKETAKTGKLPIYINLKEWKIAKPWNLEDNPPTVQQLHEFVKVKIINNDPLLAEFFDKYYMRMYETGRLYFILDSFDEIPAVLDEKDRSPLIKCLSKVMYNFLKGARTEEAQGILSSRIFRKPTIEFDAGTLLEIRPFSEEKMIQVLRDKTLTHTLFAEKPDFVTIARNPLLASLVRKYIENNEGKLPDNQVSVFESHIHHCLSNRICQEKMQEANLSETEVIKVTMDIATFIFTHYGLECPIKEIISNIKHPQIEAILDILKISRLARQNAATHIFSFIHRRFCEYFVVCKWITDDSLPDINTIPEDTKNRDALVLYCGVAKEEKARLIANFCWDNIKHVENLQNPRALHSFRFLCDAFIGRNECIVDFQQELGLFIEKQIQLTKEKQNDFISAKLAIEGLRLFPDSVYIDEDNKIETSFIQFNLWEIFQLKNNWLNEIAFKSARSLDQIYRNLLLELSRFILTYNIWTAFKNRKSMLFSLDLSHALKEVRIQYQLLLIIPYLLPIWFIAAFFIAKKEIMDFMVFSFSIFIGGKVLSLIMKSMQNIVNKIESKSKSTEDLSSGIDFIFNYLWLLGLGVFLIHKTGVVYSMAYFLPRLILVISFLLIFLLDKIYYFWLLHKASKIGDWLEKRGIVGLILNRLLFVLMPILYICGILIIFLSVPFLIVYIIYFVSKESYHAYKSQNYHLLKNGAIASVFVILVIYMIYKLVYFLEQNVSRKTGDKIVLAIILGFFSFTFLYGLSKGTYTYFYNRKIYKNINKEKLNTRPYIYECFNKLSGYYQRKLITYLENNIKEVSGEWTNKDILNISNEEANIRLAKLEEKWLGLDR